MQGNEGIVKALALVGGPRKGQATDSLTDAVLRGLTDAGARAEKFYLYDLDIKPCRGCGKCRELGRCEIEDDDFARLAGKFNEADIIVFASPVYVSNVTSVMKKFMDRGVSLLERGRFGPVRRAKKPSRAILICSCGAPYPFSHLMGIIPGCLNAMRSFFKYMPVSISALAVPGMGEFVPASHARLLEKAYRLGKATV